MGTSQSRCGYGEAKSGGERGTHGLGEGGGHEWRYGELREGGSIGRQ
jgi:hypothetical protein